MVEDNIERTETHKITEKTEVGTSYLFTMFTEGAGDNFTIILLPIELQKS